MAGEIIAGRFELIEHIAQGGSGTVWLARDLKHERICAAKVMRQSYSGEILRFVREQGVKFDHPHLLSPYGWAAVDERVLIATELMRGGNLHTAMQDYGAFSQELVAEILVQLLDGLAHVHASGWVHRDVKPANVLLESTSEGVPVVRLADFGIAAHRDEPRLTEHGAVVGTQGFIAPELRGGSEPEPAGDLYALGVLAVQLLEPSLRGDALSTYCDRARFSVDAQLSSVLGGLLARDPAKRLATARDASSMLAVLRNPSGYQVASGEPFEVFDHFESYGLPEGKPSPQQQPAGQPVSVPEPVRGKPARSAARLGLLVPWIAVLLALALGGLSLWLVFGGQSEADSVSPGPTVVSESPVPSSDPVKTSAAPSSSMQSKTPEQRGTEPSKESTSQSVVSIHSNVSTGDNCNAIELGLNVSGADGHRLSCEVDGAEYRWVAQD